MTPGHMVERSVIYLGQTMARSGSEEKPARSQSSCALCLVAVSGSVSGSVSGLAVIVQRAQKARARSGQGGVWKHPERHPALGPMAETICLVTEPPIVHFSSLLCRLGGVVLDVLLKQAMPSLLLGSVTCESDWQSYRGAPLR